MIYYILCLYLYSRSLLLYELLQLVKFIVNFVIHDIGYMINKILLSLLCYVFKFRFYILWYLYISFHCFIDLEYVD